MTRRFFNVVYRGILVGLPNLWPCPSNFHRLVQPRALGILNFSGIADPRRMITARHPYTPNTFITSSPKWLITLTAILPVPGRGKGRETSR